MPTLGSPALSAPQRHRAGEGPVDVILSRRKGIATLGRLCHVRRCPPTPCPPTRAQDQVRQQTWDRGTDPQGGAGSQGWASARLVPEPRASLGLTLGTLLTSPCGPGIAAPFFGPSLSIG